METIFYLDTLGMVSYASAKVDTIILCGSSMLFGLRCGDIKLNSSLSQNAFSFLEV